MIGAAMGIVKVGVLAPTNKGIPLGVQGENRATQVEFDTRPWFREYPSGTVSAVAKRYGDKAPYPLTLNVEDGTAVWHVSDTDTAKAGEGAVELTMTSAGVRVRSLTFKTLVTASLTDAPVDDDAWYGWLDKAVVKVDETVQSAQRKMTEVDAEWTGIKVDVGAKVEELGDVAAQAASDAHHAKVDAQATAKALESAEHATAQKVAAENAKDAAESFKAGAEAAKGEAATSARNAADSAENAANSARAAANSVNSINVIASKTVNVPASSSEQFDVAIGQNAKSSANQSIAIGVSSEASHLSSIALGGFAKTSKDYEVAIGTLLENGDDVTREITHVTTPTGPNSASTKKYTDNNDAKTLSEAKKYTDANTSNALVGTVSGKLLHVEDAWHCKPLGLTINGAYKQDGTPSHENPVPITVIENPVLKVTGRNLLDFSSLTAGYSIETTSGEVFKTQSGKWCATLQPIQIPESLDALTLSGNGTSYQTSIIFYDDDDSFVANRSIGVTPYTFKPPANVKRIRLTAYDYDYTLKNTMVEVGKGATYASYSGASLNITLPAEHPYLAALPDGTHDEIVIDKDGNASLVARVGKTEAAATDGVSATVGNDALSSTGELADGATVYYKLATPVTYSLGKLDIPALPETISNVWIEANLTPECAMTYKQDVNVVIAGLTAQIAALKCAANNDESTASQADANVVLDNDVNVG